MKTLFCIAALAAFEAVAVPATVFPKRGWTDVKVERHPDAVTVVAGGEWMRLAPYPNESEYVEALVVSNTEDALVIDAQKVFRLGARVILLTGGGIDPKPFRGREATVVTEWSGAYGTRVTPFIEGADTEGHHWYRHDRCDVTPRRRAFRMTHRIDENVAHLHWRLDINDAQKSPICFYRATFGEPAEFALTKQTLPPQELLFHASFDNGCTADFAKGKREPTVLRNIPLVSGRRGQAVRFSREAKGALGYSAPGNVRPDCGTMSFWFKREWKEKKLGIVDGGVFRQNDYWRTIFKLRDRNAIARDGGISFWWWGPTLRTDRGDLDSRCQCNPEFACRKESADWCHYVFVWDDTGTRVYFNGDTAYPGTISDSYSPQRHALEAAPPPLEFDRSKSVFENFFLGGNHEGNYSLDGSIDELKIWSAPMREEEALKLYWKEMDAKLSPDLFYGTAGEPKTVTLTVRAKKGGRSLAGLVPVLFDAAGAVVARGTALETSSGRSKFQLTLPEGEYRFGFDEKEHVVCRAEPYWVLAKGNPVSLPPTDRVGEPAEKKLLYTIRPDLAHATDESFRAVGTCRMQKLGDVPYLEAGGERDDRFAIRLHFATNVPVHLVEIDYPDDKLRTMDITLQYSQWRWSDSTLQVGRMCGDEYPLTNRILTHRCLYWTGAEDCALIALTARKGAPAAISEVRVYEIPGGAIPAARIPAPKSDVPRRVFGSNWEDPAINNDFAASHDSEKSLNLLIDRMAAYMKYMGQDVLVYPGAFYQGLIAHGRYNPRQKSPHFLQAWMEKFDREGLFLIPKINLQCVPFDDRLCTRETMLDGSLHPTAISIWNTGKPSWGGWHGQPPNFNISHPDVQAGVEHVFDALVADGKGHPSFRGICLHLTSITCPWWGSIVSGYNDYTIEMFEKATGAKVRKVEKAGGGGGGGVGGERNDPLRGKAYYETIRADPQLYEKWVTWRCRFLTDFYARLAAKLAAIDPTLVFYISAGPSFDINDPAYGTTAAIARAYREAGIDVAMLKKAIPNLIISGGVSPAGWRHSVQTSNLSSEQKAKKRALADGDAYWSFFRDMDCFWLHQHDAYWENAVGGNRVGKDILSGGWLNETRWRVTALNANEPYSMKYYALPFKCGDIQGFTRGGFLIGSYGSEPALARFAQYFRALPQTRFTETLADGNVVIRTGSEKGCRWYYAVNVTDKPQTVSLDFPSGTRDAVTGSDAGGCRRITFAPYEFRSFAFGSGE